MKHFNRLFILGAALIVSTVSFGQTIDLFFSEYVEGSSNNKALEIYNGTGAEVNLTGYSVVLFANGAQLTSPTTTLPLTGTLANNNVFVIANSSAVADLKDKANVLSGVTNFNGDDAIVLFSGTTIIDVIGQVGFRPTSKWGDNDTSTLDRTLRRKSSVCRGDNNPNDIFYVSKEWEGFAMNDFTGIGTHTAICGDVNKLPVISNISTSLLFVTSSNAVTVSAKVGDDDGQVTAVGLYWGTSAGNATNLIVMTNGGSGDIYTTITPIPEQVDGTTIYYVIGATDNEPETSTSPILSYTVFDPKTATLPYTQEFSADLGDFYTFSASGNTKKWGFSNGYALMNGHNSGELERDFLISPAFDLTSTQNEVISFKTWRKWGIGDNADKYLKLMYSTNYAGLGDATAATWTEVPGVTMASANEVWTKTEDVDVSMVTGSKVHFAFVYNYAADYVQWQVDSVVVKENVPTAITKNHAFATIVNTVVSNNLIIQSENAVQLRIYNLAGREVKSVGYAKGEVSLSSLPKGIYIVKLTQGNNIITRRISKQ